MKNIPTSLAPAAVAAALSLAAIVPVTAFGEAVYQNDFASRASAAPIPYGDWREVPYSAGKLVNDSYSDVFGASDLQDNWIKGRNNCDGFAHVVDDAGNMEALVCNDANPDGIDSWTRLNRTAGDIMLVGGGNPAMGFGEIATNEPAFATHDLGRLCKSGTMTTAFYWTTFPFPGNLPFSS